MGEAASIRQRLARHGIPPTRLHPVPARFRGAVSALWFTAVALFLMIQVGALALSVERITKVDPAFTAAGLSVYDADIGPGFLIQSLDDDVAIPDDSVLVSIEGHAVGPDMRSTKAAKLLARVGNPLHVVVRPPGGPDQAFAIPQGPKIRGERLRDSRTAEILTETVPQLLVPVISFVLLLDAVLLRRRRRDDPVSLMLSFSFLMMGGFLPNQDSFLTWIGADRLNSILPGIWIGLLLIVLPAFPDGRFVSRWGAWASLLALPLTVAIVVLPDSSDFAIVLIILGGLTAASTMVARYRRTDPGLERQQIKWAAMGFFGSMLILGITGLGAIFLSTITSSFVASIVAIALLLCLYLAIIILPFGMLISLLRYRLWDADAAIGRSLGYATMTLIMGCTWAASMALLNQMIAGTVGGNRPLIAGISAVVVALIFGPARERINIWVENRFLPGVVALKQMPNRLNIWQHGDDPTQLGDHIVAAVTNSLHAQRVAVLLYTDDGYRSVGSEGVVEAEIARWSAAHLGTSALAVDNLDRRDPLFPLRITLDDGDLPIGVLLMGPRTDGSIYAKDEREAIEAIENPLAAALRQTQRRWSHDQRLEQVIATLERRIAELEGQELVGGPLAGRSSLADQA